MAEAARSHCQQLAAQAETARGVSWWRVTGLRPVLLQDMRRSYEGLQVTHCALVQACLHCAVTPFFTVMTVPWTSGTAGLLLVGLWARN